MITAINRHGQIAQFNGLRRRVGKSPGKSRREIEKMSVDDIRRLVRNLQSREIELETQHCRLHQVQLELEDSRHRYASLNAFTPVGLLTLTITGVIVEANQTAMNLMGISRERLISKKITAFIAPESLGVFRQLRRRVLATEVKQGCRLEMRRNNSSRFTAEVDCVHVRNGRRDGESCLMAFSDITERRRTEDAAVESSQFNRQIVASAKEGIIVYGSDLKFQVWNPFMEQLTGVAAAEVIGKYPTEVFPFLRATGMITQLKKALAGESTSPVEFFFRMQKTGHSAWVSDTSAPLRNSKGEIVGVIGIVRDISERKVSNAILQESEERLRQMAENVDEVFWMLDAITLHTLYVSPAYENIWGRTCKSRYDRTQSWLDTVHPEDRKRVAAAFKQVVRRKSFHEEYRIVLPDGSIRWIGDSGAVVCNQAGSVYRIVGVARDITLRRRAEERLMASEERYRYLVECAPIAIFIGSENRFAYLNPAALKLFGARQPEQILGQPVTDFVHPDFLKNFAHRIASKSASVSVQEKFLRLDGTPLDVEVTAVPVQWGEQQGEQVIVHDITPRKRAEDALRKNEQELADFFTESPLGLFWAGPDGRIVQVNQAELKLLDRRLEEVLGRPVSQFYLDSGIIKSIRHRLAKKETVQNCRARLRQKNGGIKHVLIDANGLWEKGRLIHTRWFVRDITRRVELEVEILSISEREQRRLGQDLHDDLCQQLAGIEFLTQTLRSALAANSRHEAVQAQEIARMVRVAMHKTRELAHGLSPVRLEDEGLMNAFRELAERIRTVFQIDCRFNCRKAIRVTDDTVSIHLYRIAQEAVSNAIKHGKAQRIDIGLAAKDGGVVLKVSNNGVALPRSRSNRTGMGMRIMQYRAGIIGGSLVVKLDGKKKVTLVCTVSKGLRLATGRE